MTRVYVDIETFSSTDLRAAGVYRYSEDPTFEILMAGWSVDGGPVEMTEGHRACIEQFENLQNIFEPTFVAHNAPFERICFSRALNVDFLEPEMFDDTMARAGEWGRPQSLDALAKSLGAEEKDSAGTALINFFCKPNRKGQHNMPEDHPEKWQQFLDYCRQDVVTLVDIDQRLPPWPSETERRVWLTDQRINDLGIQVDLPMAVQAVEAAEENRMVDELEITNLTGIHNPSSQPQMLKWCQDNDLGNSDLQAETIKTLLARPHLTTVQRRVLELRQGLALTASKKFTAALQGTSLHDERLRGGFRFFGAHTGRWSGRGLQLQNLPRAGLASEAQTSAAIADLMLGFGASAEVLKQLVRPMLKGPFTVVDYSAIEARVVAWLADEVWALAAFAEGRDIYVETAERMGGLTRAQGKIAVLALGYNGGTNSLRNMGAEGDDAELQMLVDQWRHANKRIVNLWSTMGNAVGEPGRVGKRLRISSNGSEVHMHLPSGRAIVYHDVRWERYRVVDPRTGKAIAKEGWRYRDPKGLGRIGTYGGRLVENATQAVARDLLAEALVRLWERGYKVVGHIHDEVIVEGEHDVEEVAAIMSKLPAWASGMPVSAEGYTCDRYRKS